MGFLDVVLGRKKLKEASEERIFALSTAQVTLQTELGLKTAGSAAVVFKPLSAGEFVRAENEMQSLLDTVAQSSGSKVDRKTDDMGFEWLIVHDPDIEDLVTTTHLIGSELKARGFGQQLLAAVFPFVGGEHKTYWIYGYKRGAWWPFIPLGDGKERDNAGELELKAKLEKELPIEQDLTRWLALFDAPV
ncbi:MAG: PspA-associated protein PspAB [Gaiellaceae bacterium]